MVTMAELIGATIAMLLFGSAVAWIVRKATGITAIPSYVVGVGIMSVAGGWLYSLGGYHTFTRAWTIYLIGGLIALAFMIIGDTRRAKPTTPRKSV